MEIRISAEGGTTDISQLVTTATWSGDISQCGRTLSFGVASSPVDTNIPAVDMPLGAAVWLGDGGPLFEGHIFSRQKLTGSSAIDVTCFDRGIYLKRNETGGNFEGMAPEDIAARVCLDFDIPVGKFAKTGVKVSRNFVGVTIYQIIQTAYTLAAKTTGAAYQIRFNGGSLDVVEKAVGPETLVLRGGSNLMSAAVTESIEKTVTQVAIYGDDDRLIGTKRNDGLVKLYGVMQKCIKQTKDGDADADARKLLDDNGVSQKITVENLGDARCITGNAVVVQEPYTGLYGLFWIDSDVHTWKNGLYLNKLTLNFRRLMDEQEAGSLPEAKPATGGAKKEPVQAKWEYVF